MLPLLLDTFLYRQELFRGMLHGLLISEQRMKVRSYRGTAAACAPPRHDQRSWFQWREKVSEHGWCQWRDNTEHMYPDKNVMWRTDRRTVFSESSFEMPVLNIKLRWSISATVSLPTVVFSQLTAYCTKEKAFVFIINLRRLLISLPSQWALWGSLEI